MRCLGECHRADAPRNRVDVLMVLKPGFTSGGYVSLAAQDDPRRANSGPAIVTAHIGRCLAAAGFGTSCVRVPGQVGGPDVRFGDHPLYATAVRLAGVD